MEALLAAKTKLVTDYLMLAQQMNHTANSMTNYVSALAALPSHADTVQHLVPVPQLPPAEPFNEFLQELKGGKSPNGASSIDMPKGAKVSVASAGVEEGGKKRGRKSNAPKKEKDPNAPKRPASAYIIFQNEMRPRLREAYPELAYKDLLTKISEEWKAVPEDKKNTYNDAAKVAMDEWRKENAAYQATKEDGTSPAAHAATPAVEEEEEEAAEPPKKKARAQSEESTSDDDSEGSSSSSEDEPPAPPVKPSSSKKAAASPKKSSKKQK